MAMKLGDSNTKINTGGKDRLKFEDLFEVVKFPNQEFKSMRPMGDISALGTHWFEISGVNKQGERYKSRTGRTCRNVQLDGTINPNGGCAFCKIGHSPRTDYYQNMFDIEELDNPPRKLGKPTPEERKSGFKQKGSALWTPAAVLKFPPTVAEIMQKLTKKNKDKENKISELSDPSYGRALDISRDTRDGVSPANMWNVQKCDVPMRKLSPEHRAFYLYDLSLLAKLIPSAKESLADMKYIVPLMLDKDIEALDLSDYPELLAKRSGGKTKKSKGGKFKVDDDDDDDTPRRSSKRKSESRSSGSSTKKKKRKKSFNVDDVM